MADYIDRQQAIDVVVSYFCEVLGRETISEDTGLLCRLRNIPSADVRENVRGEWTHKSKMIKGLYAEWWYECSVCGRKPPKSEWTDERYLSNFCPNCGADMRGEKE